MSYSRDLLNDLKYNPLTGEYEAIYDDYHTLTINPIPADATVVLTAQGYTQSGNSITVSAGTSVFYSVSKTGYITESNTVTVNSDITTTVELEVEPVVATLVINALPVESTITFSAGQVSGNTTTVVAGTEVTYTVSCPHYITQSDTITVDTNTTLSIRLEVAPYPTPQIVFDNTVPVNYSQTVAYWINKENYVSVTGVVSNVRSTTVVDVPLMPTDLGQTPEYTILPVIDNALVIEDATEGSDLGPTGNLNQATLRIIPIPADSTVVLTSPGATQVNNSITVPLGQSVNWSVSHTGYITMSGTTPIIGDQAVRVSLNREIYSVNYINPDGGLVQIWDSNTGMLLAQDTGGAYTLVESDTEIDVSITKEGYVDYVAEEILVTAPISQTINLTPRNYPVTITCSEQDAVIKIDGVVSATGTVYAPFGSRIIWEVSKTGYQTEEGALVVGTTGNTVNVTLELLHLTYIINPTPNNATVTFTLDSGTKISETANSITVTYGSVISWTVSATEYVTQTSLAPITVLADATESVTLDRVLYLVDVNIVTPSNPNIVLVSDGYAQVGNTINVPKDAIVTYTFSQIGYITETGNITISGATTITCDLDPAEESEVTISPLPANATVTFYTKQYIESYLNAWEYTETVVDPSIVYTREGAADVGDTLYDSNNEPLPAPTDVIVSRTSSTRAAYVMVDGNQELINYVRASAYDIQLKDWAETAGKLEDPNTIVYTVGEPIKYVVSAQGYLSSTGYTTITQDAQTINVTLEEIE